MVSSNASDWFNFSGRPRAATGSAFAPVLYRARGRRGKGTKPYASLAQDFLK